MPRRIARSPKLTTLGRCREKINSISAVHTPTPCNADSFLIISSSLKVANISKSRLFVTAACATPIMYPALRWDIPHFWISDASAVARFCGVIAPTDCSKRPNTVSAALLEICCDTILPMIAEKGSGSTSRSIGPMRSMARPNFLSFFLRCSISFAP